MRLDLQAREVRSPAKAQRRNAEFDPETLRLCAFAGERSPILDALGPRSFAEFKAVAHPGTILWCNFDLLRELGFSVPASNQLTPALNQELLATLSLRSCTEVNGHQTVTLFADKYGGEGVTPALGAGRAGFLPQGNLYVKGLGFTPLFRHNDKDDFVHSHGGVHLEDCLSEAVFGEVNHNLFTLGANRIVAIIDQGKHVTQPSGKRRHIALAIRAGAQLRPGHLLAKRARGSQSPLEMFVSMTRATKQLVLRAGLPDVAATMLRVVDDHALTAADSFRWRLIHGALSPSNMDISGAMLDLATQSTQPRTAPIFKLDYVNSAFGTEHKERGYHLAETYRRVLRSTDPQTRERFNARWVNVSNEMDQAYEKHLRVKLLAATGLKSDLARTIAAENSELATRFTKLVLRLAELKNAGSAWVARRVVEDVSVVDVFNLLGQAPREYFSERGLTPESVRKHLRPIYKGNRFHVAKKKELVASLAREFAEVYDALMRVSLDYAGSYYDDRGSMIALLTARAAFENEPIEALYGSSLYERLNHAIAEYKASGKADRVGEIVEQSVARSLRSVERLLSQGEWRRLEDGGIEIERRTIRGVSYAVHAWNDRAQTRTLHVSVPREFHAQRYCFTTDDWKTKHEVRGAVEFNFKPPCLIGRLEGFFVGEHGKTRRFNGYSFVIPDRLELKKFHHG